ncbi:helix-turn-helix transcriptional regulator, partial [Acidithiobacillus ferrooxidans]|uniref:helix-turn-helix domain-containing protein n=1 Tax=Acidithiobacillus ferrooxidans TaxID=920 RepID=UPI001C07D952
MNAQDLLEAAKTHTGLSQNGLAEAIGIRQPTLSQWNAGKTELSDETYIKLAKLAGVDPTEVIIEKHMRKAGPEARAVWARINAAVSKSAVLGLGAILLLPALHTHADTSKFQVPHNKYY